MNGDTIAAVSTPPGTGGIGVIRLSGIDAPDIAARVFRRPGASSGPDFRELTSHRLVFGHIHDPATGVIVDEVLLAWMAGPNTYTCEETVEISCHGGPVPLQETLRVVLAAGARPAEPGEFTLRAFLNGRLDLAQAEAVLDVVGARSAEGLRLAVAELQGDLSNRIEPARQALVSLLAYLDAAADFPDDEIPSTDIDGDLTVAFESLDGVVEGATMGMLYREGAQVALVGRTNVGKSSLMNALLRSDRAIVTPVAGTTRDVVSEMANIDGIPVTILDTAGITETADVVEKIGIERSRRALASAAAAVLVLDGSRSPGEEDVAVAELLRDRLGVDTGANPPVVIGINKQDLPGRADQDRVLDILPDAVAVEISASNGSGIDRLEAAIAEMLRNDAVGGVQPALITARQRAALERARERLGHAAETRALGLPIDLMATDVRAALHALGEVSGENVDEAVLNEIFSRFCIGK